MPMAQENTMESDLETAVLQAIQKRFRSLKNVNIELASLDIYDDERCLRIVFLIDTDDEISDDLISKVADKYSGLTTKVCEVLEEQFREFADYFPYLNPKFKEKSHA